MVKKFQDDRKFFLKAICSKYLNARETFVNYKNCTKLLHTFQTQNFPNYCIKETYQISQFAPYMKNFVEALQ